MDDLAYIMNSNPYYDTWDRHNSIAISANKGLRNAPGENNCFVNSAVQVFWHLDVFRRSYRRLNGHACMGDSCIFCALKIIFTQFQYSDQKSLHPDALRKALAETFANQQRFQLGHMDDAAECFENILRRIHFHIANGCEEDTCNAPHCLPHQKFAMQVVDQVVCPCGASSDPLKFHEMVHYISSSALVSQARAMHESGDILHPERFGLLLRNASTQGDVRDCPGNCGGKKVPIRRTLVNCPDVVSIGLVWECDHPTVEMTTEVARNIGTTILLQDVFHSVMKDVKTLPKLHLVGLVCYYGKHYSTFLFHSKQKVWIYFDDATVREIGPHWENVVEKCGKGRYQPLLLIYANPNAHPVPVETAPRKKVMIQGYTSGPMVDDSDSGHDRTHDSISSLNSTPRRSRTPNPDTGMEKERRSRPGQEYRPDPNNVPKRTDSDHRRQPSFLIAMSGKERPRAPLRPGGSAPYLDKENMDYGYNPNMSSKHQYESQGQELSRGHVDDYTLSTRDQYRRPSLNGYDPNNVSSMPPQNSQQRLNEAQRKEPNKKGSKQVRADVIRYVTPPNEYGPTGFNGPPPGEGPPPYSGRQAQHKEQNYDDSLSIHSDIVNQNQHRLVKSTSGNVSYDNMKNSSHTPVDVGIATLPRNKKKQSPNEQGSMTRQASMGNLSVQGTHSRQSSRDLVDGSSSKPEPPKPKQTRKTVAQVKRAADKKKPPPPQRSNSLPRGTDSERHPEEFVDDKVVYIDRKMVANILDYQKQKSDPNTRSNSSNGNDSLMNKLLASKGLHRDHDLSVEIPYDNVSLGSHKDSGYGSSDRNSSSSTGSVTMDPYNQFFLTRGMIVPTPTPVNHNYINHDDVTPPKIMSKTVPNMKQDGGRYGKLPGDIPPPVPVKNYSVEKECPQLDMNKDVVPGLEREAMKNEQFMSLIRFSEELMDQCMLAETNKDFSSAKHYCDTAIGYLKNAVGLKNSTHQMLTVASNLHSSCVVKARNLHAKLSSRPDSKLSPANDLTGSSDNRSSINSTDSDISRASQDRTRRMNSSTETLDSQDKGYSVSQSVKHSPSGGPFNTELDRQRLPDNPRNLSRTLSDHNSSKSAIHSHSDSNSSSRTCVPSGHVSQGSRDSTISGHMSQNSRDSTISGHVSQSSTLSNNSDMYGSLPRRTKNTQLSKENQQDVYQSYLSKQKALNQGVEHTRTSSGSSTSNSLDGSVHSDNSGSDPQLRSHLRSQPRMSKSDIRQILHNNLAIRQAHGQGQTNNGIKSAPPVQSSRNQQNSSPVPNMAQQQFRQQPQMRPLEVGKPQQASSNTTTTSQPLNNLHPTGLKQSGPKPPVSVKPQPPLKPCLKQKPTKVMSTSLSKSSNCLNAYGGKPLERCTSQPDCQKLVENYSYYNHPGDKFSNPLFLTRERGLRSSSASQPDLRNIDDENFNRKSVKSNDLIDSSDEEANKLNVRALASRFETTTSLGTNSSSKPVTDNERPHVGHRVRSKSESSSTVKKPKSVLSKNKNKNSRPRKSVTFSENLASVAGIDFSDYNTEKSNSMIMDDHAYFSDDDDRRPLGHHNDEDIDSNNSDESPPIGMGPGFCQLCQKKGIEIDENYCSKCRFYMHRFMPSN